MTKLINNLNITILILGMIMFISFPSKVSAETSNEGNPTATVTGVVTSETGEPIIGGTVSIKGGTTGTSTDATGAYSIQAEPTATLVFSYIGMKTQEISIDGRSKIDVVLIENTQVVDEVVVVGYGTQRKSELTGSISKVKNEQLDQIPMGRVDDALVGQVAGVNIQMTNPAAGEAPTIRIRGQGSISFDSNPLIVVDGIVVGTDADFLASLDMNDIESIEILKDAASSAIYGSRGANGIVMVTTKQGKEGPMKLSYDSYVGWKSVPATDVLTTVDEWSAFVRANNDGNLTDRFEYIDRLGTYTNWEEVMMEGGMIQSHSLSGSGGTKNTKFRMSASYLNDEGVLLTDNFQKLNFRLNLSTKINKRITFGTTLNPSHTEQRRFPIGVHDAIRQSPWLPTHLDENSIQFVNRFREPDADNIGRWADVQEGDYAMERMFDDYDLLAEQPDSNASGTDISSTSNQGSYAKVVERDRRKYQTKVYANTYLKVKIADGLTFKQVVGGDFRTTRNTTWIGVQASRNGAGDAISTLNTNNRFHSVFESTLNYKKSFGEHSISALGGYTYEGWTYDISQLSATDYQFDYIRTISTANLITEAYSIQEKEALVSYLGRFNYSFADKYFLSISARRDGSSKFGTDNKYGFFPAISGGWNIANEKFMEDVELIEQLKIRASYGNSGSNSGIGRYDYIGLLDPVSTGINGVGIGFNPINIANLDLRWEKLIERNLGIDVSILNGRISAAFDLYSRTSSDLLLDLPIPSVTGFQEALVNRGIVDNRGFELELRSVNYRSDDFSWKSSFILTRNINELVDFAGASGLISIVDDKRPTEWIAIEGQPISSFYGYVVSEEIGLEYIKNPFYPINGQSQDIYVKDLNGDGLIDTDDRTILGSPYPDFIWTINNTISYKDLDISFMFQGSQGAEVRNISSQYIKNEFSSNQDVVEDFEDKDKVVERIFTNDDIQDASYIALRNLNIGYTLTNKINGLNRARVYVGAQNLLYRMSEGYEGYNPEGIDQGLGNPLTWGYQRGPAPIYRTFSIGVNLTI